MALPTESWVFDGECHREFGPIFDPERAAMHAAAEFLRWVRRHLDPAARMHADRQMPAHTFYAWISWRPSALVDGGS